MQQFRRATGLSGILTALVLLLGQSAALAQEPAAPTAQQQQMLAQMRDMFRKSMGRDPTADEERQFLEAAGRTQMQVMGAIAGLRGTETATPAVASPSPVRHDATVAPTVSQTPSIPGAGGINALRELLAEPGDRSRFFVIQRRNSGFTVDGKPHVDANGTIADFGADPKSGLVTYLVDAGNGTALVKVYKAGLRNAPVLAGRLTTQGNRTIFEGVDGQTAAGQTVVPMSNGLLLTRDESAVLVGWNGETTTRSIPQGYRVAQYQNGDVAGTHTLLLESTKGPTLMSGLEGMKELFGKSKASDYALYHLDSERLIPLQFTKGKNDVNFRTPRGLVTRESIHEQDGSPNYSHYYRSIAWANTRQGPVAVVLEKGLQDLNLIDLHTGDRHNVVHRAAGIQRFEIVPLADGDFEIRGGWAFKDHPIRASEVLAGQRIE